MAEKQTDKNAIGKGRAGPGRPKGVPNKTTALLKDAILQAATDAGNGDLVSYLATQAVASPAAFLSLLGKVLPMQITGLNGGAIRTDSRFEIVLVKSKPDAG